MKIGVVNTHDGLTDQQLKWFAGYMENLQDLSEFHLEIGSWVAKEFISIVDDVQYRKRLGQPYKIVGYWSHEFGHTFAIDHNKGLCHETREAGSIVASSDVVLFFPTGPGMFRESIALAESDGRNFVVCEPTCSISDRLAYSKQNNEIEEVLGKALGYEITDVGPTWGEHTAETLAMEAAATIGKLKEELEQLKCQKS